MPQKFRALATLAIALTLTACQSSDPKSIADSHLSLIKSGKAADANQQYCLPGDTLTLHSVKSFQITSSQPSTKFNLPYTEVIAKIQSDQYRYEKANSTPQKIPLDQITIQVWESDTFYQALVASTAKVNDLTRSTKALTGANLKLLPTPEREKVSKKTTCIYIDSDQVESKVE